MPHYTDRHTDRPARTFILYAGFPPSLFPFGVHGVVVPGTPAWVQL